MKKMPMPMPILDGLIVRWSICIGKNPNE